MNAIEIWKAQGDYFTFRGHSIFYRSEGSASAPVLVLIHGFPTASWDYYRLWPELSQHFRLITLDMIGFGLSAKPRKHQYSLMNQADLFESLLQHLQISQYHILAHDYGDTVAQELIARDSEAGVKRIQSVILLNGGLFPEAINALIIQKLLLGPLGPIVARLTNIKKFKKNFLTICNRPIAAEELEILWQLITRENGRLVMAKLIQYMKERVQHKQRWTGALVNAKIPIRFVNGLLDPISGQKMVDRYKELIPQSDIIALSDVGHYPQIEAPREVLTSAMDFWVHNKILR